MSIYVVVREWTLFFAEFEMATPYGAPHSADLTRKRRYTHNRLRLYIDAPTIVEASIPIPSLE